MATIFYIIILAIPLWFASAALCCVGTRWQSIIDTATAATDRVNRLQVDLNFARNDQRHMEQLVSHTLDHMNRLEADLDEYLGRAPSIDFRATATLNPVRAFDGEYVDIIVRAHGTIMLDRHLRELAGKYPQRWIKEFYYCAEVTAKLAADDTMKQIAGELTTRETLSREVRMYERRW